MPVIGSCLSRRSDGQRGTYAPDQDGTPRVRLDRGSLEVYVPYKPSEWNDAEAPRLLPIQVAKIAYDADRSLRLASGTYQVPEWNSLHEDARIGWIKNGPKEPERAALYRAIKGVFE